MLKRVQAERRLHQRHTVIVGVLVSSAAAMAAIGFALSGALSPIPLRGTVFPGRAPATLVVAPVAPAITLRQADTARRILLTSQLGPVMTTFPRREGGTLLASSVSVNGVAFSPDGKLMAIAYGNGTIRQWNLVTDSAYGSPLPAGSSVSGLAFSPDGKLLASADTDGTVQLWNPATGQPVRSPLPAGSSVTGVAFSPDGKLLASAGTDGTVQLWNPATGQPVGPPLLTGSSVSGVAFSAHRLLTASANADGSVRWWSIVISQPTGLTAGGWFVLAASVVGLALSALVIAITVPEIKLARNILE